MARTSTFSPVLVSLLGIAVAAGAAATFVVSSTVSYTSSTPLNSAIPSTLLGALLLLPFVGAFAWIIYRRITGGGLPMSKGVVAGALLLLAIMIVVGILAGVLGSHPQYYFSGNSGSGPGGSTPPKNNTTAPPPGGSGVLAPASFQVVSVPGWVVLVVVFAIGLAVVGLAIPSYSGWSARRRARREATLGAPEREAASVALAQALSELDRGSDPREVIERLYTRFLDRVVPLAGDLAVRTPEEIRVDTLLPLGVRPAAAGQLTRVFEEARYSSHPMNPEKAATVREAVRLAATDLTRFAPTP